MEGFRDMLDSAATLATENSAVQILLIILVTLLLHTIVHRYIGRIIREVVKTHKYESRKVERQREQTLIGILRTTSALVIWAISIMLILTVLDVNIAALVTGAGLIGVVVGLGAQSTIKDIVAGIFIIAENQYRVGDVITIAEKSGVVEDISIRITRLRDLDGYLHIVPNGQIDTATNMTFDYANVNINVSISYESDIEKVKKVINEVGKKLAEHPDWKESTIEPISFLRVDGFDDSAVIVKILGKVTPGSQWDMAGEFRRQLKAAFEAQHIERPLPERLVHTVQEK
jgi:small conductance mechanosensitive channel